MTKTQADYITFLGNTYSESQHAHGNNASWALLKLIDQAPKRALEIGFGTGNTLIKFSSMFPETELHGIEKSNVMLNTTKKRLKYNILKHNIQLKISLNNQKLPFDDNSFEVIYCESVLGILNEHDLKLLIPEIYRVLKTNGTFITNESIWLDTVNESKKTAINTQCELLFGIPQCSNYFKNTTEWISYFSKVGFSSITTKKVSAQIENIHFTKLKTSSILISQFFSLIGRLKKKTHTTLRKMDVKFNSSIKGFKNEAPFIEGLFFIMKKSN